MDPANSSGERGTSRTIKSCTECTRRKNRCDKQVPCSKCISRGVPHLCRVDARRLTTGRSELSPHPEDVYSQTIMELQGLREDATKYNQRVARLEKLVSTLLASKESVGQQGEQTGGLISMVPASTFTQSAAPLSPPYPSDYAERSGRRKDTTLEGDVTFPLELMALGRQAPNESGAPTAGHQDFPALSSPVLTYPSGRELALAAPSRNQAEALVSYAVGSLGWLLCCLHAPSFMAEVATFWEGGENSFETHRPAFVACYFAILVTGVQLLREDQRVLLGISQEQSAVLAKKWFSASVACLYRADFLQHHTLTSLQTIAILSHCGKDDWSANYLGTLNYTALSIAVEMNLHRMPSNEAWEADVAREPADVRAKSLIHRETSKRVFWSLNREEWLGVNWRRRNRAALRPALLSTSLVTTPAMLNTHDRDLLAGNAIDRPASEYTVVSFALVKATLAHHLQRASEYLDTTQAPSYDVLQQFHQSLVSYISTLPSWWRSGPPAPNMTSSFDWLRHAFIVTSNHKLLTLHRLFWMTEGGDTRYSNSQSQAMEAVKEMLEVAHIAGECRLFTVVYQISVSAFFTLRYLFSHQHQSREARSAQRNALNEALIFLERAKISNGIARNAFELISKLVEEEAKLFDDSSLQVGAGVDLAMPYFDSGRGGPEDADLMYELFQPFNEGDQWLFDASLLEGQDGHF